MVKILFVLFSIVCALIILSYSEHAEHFDGTRTESNYAQNFKITLERNCGKDEKDMGTYCEKSGCPSGGFERGRGANKLMCYPKCLDGYESDGSSRCYKACPIGYDTRLTQCSKPRHEYAKDIVPCRNCNLEPVVTDVLLKENIRDPTIGVITAHPQMARTAMLDMDGSVVMTRPTMRTHMNVPLDVQRAISQTRNSMQTDNVNPILSNGILQEGFDGSNMTVNSEMTSVNSEMAPINSETASVNSEIPSPPPEPANSPNLEVASSDSMISSGDYMYGVKVAQRSSGGSGVSVVDPEGQLPCPMGYSLSGDLCYENCGPQYRDEGDKCVRERYVIDRPSYDRGVGIPYIHRRPKFEQISQE